MGQPGQGRAIEAGPKTEPAENRKHLRTTDNLKGFGKNAQKERAPPNSGKSWREYYQMHDEGRTGFPPHSRSRRVTGAR